MCAVLTHVFPEHPGLRLGVDLDEYGGRADEEDHEVGDAEVHQEDIGRVPHVLGLEYDERHHDVADDSDAEDEDAEEHGGGADVRRYGGELPRLVAQGDGPVHP